MTFHEDVMVDDVQRNDMGILEIGNDIVENTARNTDI